MSIPGARGCKNCEMRFRFNDKVSLKQVLINIKQDLNMLELIVQSSLHKLRLKQD